MSENLEKTNRIADDELDSVAGGTGGASTYYCVEGYSKVTKGNVKMYVSTYEDAVKLCGLLGMGMECIKEVTNTH